MTPQVGIERVLYSLHRRICTFSLRHTSSHTRRWLEHLWLVLAICGFGGLILLHLCFVYRPSVTNVSTTCLRSIPGFTEDADVTHVILLKREPMLDLDRLIRSGISLINGNGDGNDHNYDSGITAGFNTTSNTACHLPSRAFIHQPAGPIGEVHLENGNRFKLELIESLRGSSIGADWHAATNTHTDTTTNTASIQDDGGCRTWSNAAQAGTIQIPGEVQLSFSNHKAYLQLEPDDDIQRYLRTQYVAVSPTDMNCFGENFLQTILWNIVGTDTVIVNWFLAVANTPSLLHHDDDDDDDDEDDDDDDDDGASTATNTAKDASMFGNNGKDEGPFIYHTRSGRLHSAFIWDRDYMNVFQRILLLVQTSFLFICTTTMVSFTLRETQEKMLEFTQELNRRVQGREPVQKLVSSHLLQNLVFCPIMVGMMFFLIEFYGGDKFLAFLVMTIVWIAEVFSVISLRSIQGITFFPRIFFLLFCLFHVYHFAFPFGFGYSALGTISCFILHSMLFFWHRYELPAVALGWVDAQRPRMMTSSSEASQ